MKGDVAVSLFRKSQDTDTHYKTIIGDDDSTIIALIHYQVDNEVELSDISLPCTNS